ncbi:MAG: hypothetical protein M0R28_18175 [Pigmentiphaga sp.]|nr:hypothetical protein [Pigmentiphaga sp.]
MSINKPFPNANGDIVLHAANRSFIKGIVMLIRSGQYLKRSEIRRTLEDNGAVRYGVSPEGYEIYVDEETRGGGTYSREGRGWAVQF